MYKSFFGFKCKPFQLTPDPQFLFMSRVHRRALTYLTYGVKDKYGFILLTGEIGTGKTTMIRTLLKQVPQEIKVARVTNTKVASDQLISMISEDFGLDTKGRDKTRMLSELTDFLISLYAGGGRAILIIDEAQNLTPDLLEEIRLLSNLETDKSNLLQIILIGQPELNITLSSPGLEQLRQRIAITAYISRLGREELEDYIRHRLRVAGSEDAVTFEKGALDAVYKFSKGVPRLINIICEFTLLAAFADKSRFIEAELVNEIIGDCIHERPEAISVAAGPQPPGDAAAGDLKECLFSIHLRLQNLEAALYRVQEKICFSENKSLIPTTSEEDDFVGRAI